MSIGTGILGLAKSGKTTVFNALTRGKADTARYTQGGSAPNIGITRVPESRLQTLADMLQPKSVVPASVTYIDVGASVKSLVTDKAIGGELMASLNNADALVNVVRAFSDESIPHIAQY